MSIRIIGTGAFLPPRRLTNDDLAQGLDTSDEWIRSHTGIGARHLAEEGWATSDMALKAGAKALAWAYGDQSLEEAALRLDIIIAATATPDYVGIPSTACLVQGGLGAKNAAAFDLAAGCTGFIYALETAAGLLSLGERKAALVIGAETLSRFIDWEDRGTCVLFGDGAGAVVLEKTLEPGGGGVCRSILGADGSGAESLIFRRGGSRNPFRAGETIEKGICLSMKGQGVYNFAVKALTETLERLLEAEGLQLEDLAWIVPHQANARIVQAAAHRLHIPLEKFFINIEEYANTSAASIPIALDELNRSGQLHRGDLIATVGFGGGLTYGGSLIRWS